MDRIIQLHADVEDGSVEEGDDDGVDEDEDADDDVDEDHDDHSDNAPAESHMMARLRRGGRV